MNKQIVGRVQHKHDTEANWLKAENFIPLDGELIIYDIDENNPSPRFKVGDGETVVSSLPFSAATGTGEGGSVLSVNGYTGEVVLTADDVGALTFDEDEILEDGVPIPVNAETFAGLTYDQFKEDIGLSIPDWALRLDPDDTPTAAEVVGVNAQTFAGMTYDDVKEAILNEVDVPVTSVNGKTGDVSLTYSDVNARSISWLPSIADLHSIHHGSWNGNTLPNDIPTGISYTESTESNGFPIAYSTCLSVKTSVSRSFQICVNKSTGKAYIRSSTDGVTWGAWEAIYGTNNNPTYSDVGAAAASHTHSYVPLSGGTMTGTLKIQRSSTISSNTPARLAFINVQTDNNVTTSNAHIDVYDDHDTTANGQAMVIQSTGNMIIGSGESPGTCYATDLVGNNAENMYVTADNGIYLYSNANTYANKKVATFDKTGVFNAPTLSEGGTKIASTYVKKAAFSLSGTTLTITTT